MRKRKRKLVLRLSRRPSLRNLQRQEKEKEKGRRLRHLDHPRDRLNGNAELNLILMLKLSKMSRDSHLLMIPLRDRVKGGKENNRNDTTIPSQGEHLRVMLRVGVSH